MSRPILVTRPAAQAGELARLLRARGFAPRVVPTVAIDTDSVAGELDSTLEGLEGADWLVLTSATGADCLAARMMATGRAIPDGSRVAAVGPATAEALQRAGIRVDHVPEVYLTAAIADGMGELHDRRVVLARAEAATPELREALVQRGARVEEVVAYRTLEGPPASRHPLHAALSAELCGLTFSSGSTVRGLLALASSMDARRARHLPAFCIGPVTAATARRHGFEVAAVATPHTATGLTNAVAAHFPREDR